MTSPGLRDRRRRAAADALDVAVVGGGIVGCAIAAEASRRGLSAVLLERDSAVGRGATSRNSGVLHSGLYYAPGSLAARTCVRGQALSYEMAARSGVPFRRTGKLVVAFDAPGEAALLALLENATASGAAGIRLVDGDEALRLEPSLRRPRAALWCPETGIVDAPALAAAFAREASAAGAIIAVGAELLGVSPGADGFTLDTTRGPIVAAQVVNAAGLAAPTVAALFGDTAPQIWPCRGDWFALRAARVPSRLIYPVRVPDQPGLGVHVCLDLGGGLRLGPDARFVDSSDPVEPPADLAESFRRAGERLLGPIPPGALAWAGSAIRPRLRGPDDPGPVDFRIARGDSGALHLFGVESPGLTAAPALAEEVLDRLRA
ncbi:MAG: FAD-dependent oxidoreductase [Myxococcota bacterium]